MKLAFAAAGKTLSSSLDQRFGRCPGFLVYNTETNETSYTDNSQNLNAAQGAGIQAATHVVNMGADCVLCGHCGPKAFRTLKAAGIQVICGVEGTIQDLVKKFEQGALTSAEVPNVEGHWM
ncbi:MAG: dinitrogenase iron-molybdenum cofactor biosynthesis protein [Lentisphaerae bacterium]|nr:dinitrogenase iron-molybdenum cofactor biosynthesis protein [Lentisphaerota bacterium]MCP4101784.1 dinitrogenase iron-molybdenum cofactor biosynthesis protein [Lentisphaerota bacterium]